jgi:hypothetical protein
MSYARIALPARLPEPIPVESAAQRRAGRPVAARARSRLELLAVASEGAELCAQALGVRTGRAMMEQGSAKTAIAQHGGSLAYVSTPGIGTVATIEIPLVSSGAKRASK